MPVNSIQQVLTAATIVLAAVTAGGIVHRRLHRVSQALPLYLLVVGLSEALILANPGRFHTWGFWMAKETALALLKLALAIEIIISTFQVLRGAKRTALLLACCVLTATLGAVVWVPSATDLKSLAVELQPRLANGTALLLASTWICILYYRVPLHRFQRAILRGLVPYLLVFTVAMRLMAEVGWHVWTAARFLDGGAYVMVIAYWCWEAWRPVAECEDVEVLARLQPWRVEVDSRP
jgi:hypothetical protein